MRSLFATLAIALATFSAACSLFDLSVACDDETPCADGRACGVSGFCDDDDPSGDSGVDAGTRTDAGQDPVETTTVLTVGPDDARLGDALSLHGKVSTTSGDVVNEGVLAFDVSTDDGASFAPISSLSVDATGSVGFTHEPQVDGIVYRARYLGTAAFAASVSTTTEPVTVRIPVLRTATWTSTWSVTFFGSGNPRTDPEFMFFCIQGQFSPTNGNQKCAFGFDDEDIRATLTGATIVDTELSLSWEHWAVGESGSAVVGTHNTSGAPATFQSLGDVVVGRHAETFEEGEQKWFSLGTAIGEELRDGGARGFVLGPAPNTEQSFYGYARGASQTDPPRLRISYEVFE